MREEATHSSNMVIVALYDCMQRIVLVTLSAVALFGWSFLTQEINSILSLPLSVTQNTQPTVGLAKGLNYPQGWGNCAPHNAYTNTVSYQNDIATIAQTGATIVRIETPAPLTASSSNTCTSTDLSGIVSAIKPHGMEPLLNILAWCYTPTDPTGCFNESTGKHEPGAQHTTYEAWLTNLVQTSGIQYYEIGNEENLSVQGEDSWGLNRKNNSWYINWDAYPYGWVIPDNKLDAKGVNPLGPCPNGPPAGYATGVKSYIALLKDSYQTIKAADPSAIVVLGGISSWHDECFIDQLARYGGFDYADAVGFHAYPQTFTNGNGAQGAQSVDYLQSTLVSLHKTLPIWITEFGFHAKTQAQELVMAQNISDEWSALKQSVSSPIILYQSTDEPPFKPQGNHSGLFESDGNGNILEKFPAFTTFTNLTL